MQPTSVGMPPSIGLPELQIGFEQPLFENKAVKVTTDAAGLAYGKAIGLVFFRSCQARVLSDTDPAEGQKMFRTYLDACALKDPVKVTSSNKVNMRAIFAIF